MADTFTYATPIAQATIADLEVDRFEVSRRKRTIFIKLFSPSDETYEPEWKIAGDEAWTLIVQLNKVNCTPPNTLQRRILNYLITSGRLIGTVSGSPD